MTNSLRIMVLSLFLAACGSGADEAVDPMFLGSTDGPDDDGSSFGDAARDRHDGGSIPADGGGPGTGDAGGTIGMDGGGSVADGGPGLPDATVADSSIPDAGACVPGSGPVRYVDRLYSRGEVRERGDLVYRRVTDVYGDHVLELDLYMPPTSDLVTRRPALVWMHGGFFRAGTRAQMTDYAIEYARRGWVSATITYRLLRVLDPDGELCDTGPSGDCSPQACALVAQEDAEAAFDFLRDHASTYGIDPERMVIGGFSAGSMTAFTVGYEYEALGATVPSVIGVVGLDSLLTDPSDLLRGDPPWVMVHASETTGMDDPGAFPRFVAASTALGIPNQEIVIPGTTHVDLIDPARIPGISAAVAPFLHRYALECAEE